MTTILIVDDSREVLTLLSAGLEAKGFVILTAENGKQAIETAENQDIHAIILDLSMPEMDGHEAAEHLKADERTRAVPIIACTAYPADYGRQRAMESGCDDFLEKPVDLKLLLCMLDKHLKHDQDRAFQGSH